MIEINGKYNKAIVFCDQIEDEAFKQIKGVCDLYIFKDLKIRIMPDCHLGKGCVIGFTAQMPSVVVPSLIGVDIGCGMTVVELGEMSLDFGSLDQFIKNNIPSSFDIYKELIFDLDMVVISEIERISKLTHSDAQRHLLSLGTLGGGNHFIEVNENENGKRYLVIHSGSRNFGHQIAEHYHKRALHHCERLKKNLKAEKEQALKRVRKQKDKKLNSAIEQEYEIKLLPYHVTNQLSFLEGEDVKAYLKDMEFAQRYASLNRLLIAKRICEYLRVPIGPQNMFETIHNYINFSDKIIRKGAVSAHEGEKLIIPINMRDGAIIALGKGNEDYNYSAPHGAGRLLSRKSAIEKLSMEEYEKSMQGIFSSSISEKTLDESPMAYKPIEMILNHIEETVDVLEIIRPLYNFKAE